MKRTIFALAVLGALATAAQAADLPRKAPALPAATDFLTAYTGSGFYIGANIGGGGGSANMAAANVVNLQGLVGLTLGYGWAMTSTSMAFIEGDFDVMNLSTGSNAGLTFNGPVDLDQRLGFGFPTGGLATLPVVGPLFTSIFGSGATLPPFAALAPGVTATKSTMYVFVGADEKDVSANLGEGSNKTWLIAPEIGFGNRQQLSNGFGMDTSIAAQFDSRGTCVGGLPAGVACGNIGTSFLGKLKLLY